MERAGDNLVAAVEKAKKDAEMMKYILIFIEIRLLAQKRRDKNAGAL